MDLTKLFNFAWHTKKALVVGLMVFSYVAFWVSRYLLVEPFGFVGTDKLLLEFTLPIVAAVVFAAIWRITNGLPLVRKGRIGFLVSISCESDDESSRLRSDFLDPLSQLLRKGKSADLFDFIVLPQHQADKVRSDDQAVLVRAQVGATFMLYGRVRVRQINGKPHHVLDLRGFVTHSPINGVVRNALSREFGELLPKSIRFPAENELVFFEITTAWAALVAMYIIGIAAEVSGDLDYSETLFQDVLNQAKSMQVNFPIRKKLLDRCPVRLSELYEARAFVEYHRWRADRDISRLDAIESHITHVPPNRKSEIPDVIFERSIVAFVRNRDTERAINILKQFPEKSDPVWNFNMAFLYGYTGKFALALKHYRIADTAEVAADIIAQIEEFMIWILENEPDRFQIYFCLGHFNWKTKGDWEQAKVDFENFLRHCPTGQHAHERKLVARWLLDIETGLTNKSCEAAPRSA